MADATGLMRGKRGLIMGVANSRSIAWGIAKAAHAHGAELAFTYQGDALKKRVEPLAQEVGGGRRLHCNYLKDVNEPLDPRLAATYYDAQRVFFNIFDYTKDSQWLDCAEAAEAIYRDYIFKSRCDFGIACVPGYWNFTHGLTMDYLKTRDEKSKEAVTALSENAAFASDNTPISVIDDAQYSREVAYALMAYLNRERVGGARRPRLPNYVNAALRHYDHWFIAKTGSIQAFMAGITAEALIMYYEQVERDPRILESTDWHGPSLDIHVDANLAG